MTVDSTLDQAFTLLLAKAQQRIPQPGLRPGGIDFMWGGGGQAITLATMDPLLVEVPFPSRLVWAHMYAGDGVGQPSLVTATIQVKLTSVASFGTSIPLSGTGTAPNLNLQSASDCDITDWQLNYDTGDTLIAYPTVFTGAATWLALTLQLRPTDANLGAEDVLDNVGDQMTLNDGTLLEFRS